MQRMKPEEKYPLLFYFVDGSQEFSRTNKRYFEKGRWHGIHSGAAAILTEWPNQVNGFWTTILLTSLTLFVIMLMYVSTISIQQSKHLSCINNQVPGVFDEKTVHLVHLSNIWTQDELKILDTIAHKFNNYKINLIQVSKTLMHLNKTESLPKTEGAKIVETTSAIQGIFLSKYHIQRENNTLEKRMADFKLSVQLGAKRLLDILLNNKKNSTSTTLSTTTPKYSLDDILTQHPQIVYTQTTFEYIFMDSPLSSNWRYLNKILKIFAARVVYLWQHGGVSFDLNEFHNNLNVSEITIGSPKVILETSQKNITNLNRDNNKTLSVLSFINEGPMIEAYGHGVVIADSAALHLETKSECHVFFEEILMNLRRVRKKDVTVKYIMLKTLSTFCKYRMASGEFCSRTKY